MTHHLERPAAVAAPPRFPVELAAADVSCWLPGNTGIAGVWQFAAAEPGPHVVVTALIHGNEIAGAWALDRLLRAGPAPLRGRLSLVFANLDAYARFDPENPTASRFADEDMNRLWDAAVLDGPRDSRELARARALRRVIDSADVLLDLHSMLWPGDPLILCGPTPKGCRLACAVGTPDLVVADRGHLGGRRLIDYAPFVDPELDRTAILVEAGQHWEAATVESMLASVAGVLAATGLSTLGVRRTKARFAEVTHVVTANTGAFSFVHPYRGGDVIAVRDTLIGVDGGIEIRTPHDQCLLVMPSLRPSRGHTAVRLARFVPVAEEL
jgi:predicted deacylase